MDVFELRQNLIDDYARYVSSFLALRDRRIREHVETSLRDGHLWPDPMIGLNPAFESGGQIDDLVLDGTLNRDCRSIFRVDKTEEAPLGEPMHLYRHQVEAIRAAQGGRNFVLTTGTGSGKSLAYIVPIVDHVLRNGSGNGIQAIVVYPMNALANSQERELTKFLGIGSGGAPPVTFRKYTGQEDDETRREILADPPDIILTNYVMLELILTRVADRKLVEAAQGLRFLVLDELHTYRGRQGADVALLTRRVREACTAIGLQCIGTSATLASGGSYDEQRAEIARIASLLFGTELESRDVIGETLRRATPQCDFDDPTFVEALSQRLRRADPPPSEYDSFVDDPLSRWIEATFGIEEREGRLARVIPRSISGGSGAAKDLEALTGVGRNRCEDTIAQQLLAGYAIQRPDSPFPVFPFRLHQFISKGDTVYASLEPESDRYLTLQFQRFVPGDRHRVLLPLAFCRACGQEYYMVRWATEPSVDEPHFTPRDLGDRASDKKSQAGFLYLTTDLADMWSDDPERLPEDWLEEHDGALRVKRDRRSDLPRELIVDSLGRIGDHGTTTWFVPAPFRFCLACGIAYAGQFQSDFAKLATLGSEGRSTATTILALAGIRWLRSLPEEDKTARKLLSFTDNRQDASLQAGHFNDFLQVGQLRAALLRAVEDAGLAGLTHERLTDAAFKTLDLPFAYYSTNPELRYAARADTERVMRDVLGYRLYHDLRRGWRITAPNLEQCGLLQIDYVALDDVCADDDLWETAHPALLAVSPEKRSTICRVLLDLLRRELAIKVEYLDRSFQEQLALRSTQRLQGPWSLDDDERLEFASVVVPRGRRASDYRAFTFLGPQSGYGRYLRRHGTLGGGLNLDDTRQIIDDLFHALAIGGLVEAVADVGDGDIGYQVPAASLLWRTGNGMPVPDPLRLPRASATPAPANEFFVELYRSLGPSDTGIEAHEHTAQVPYTLRQEREEDFRSGRLPILFCSPTMELGVDIADLNVVNLRNVPPTPANYAQRSGRAGRSGDPALVFTYATIGSPHDQYFFRNPTLMVAGAVTPPRLDLANEDLVRSHVQAIWLTESGMSLERSLGDLLDLDAGLDAPLRDHVRDDLYNSSPRVRARAAADRVLHDIEPIFGASTWWTSEWVDEVLNAIPLQFDQACARWRDLYHAAKSQFEFQNAVIGNVSRTAADKRIAKRLRAEAEAQLGLLAATSDFINQSDFYSYRYFAAEGFLPGYSFPRLPLSAFIPGRRTRAGDDAPDGEYVSRPRFLAISEFGPRSVVYHEGARYEISKVILPPREPAEGIGLLTTEAKRCDVCGYVHPSTPEAQPDVCERCGHSLPPPIRRLFRMQNVSTRRRDRINSDEEERQREGYELWTGVRFATRRGRLSMRTAEARRDNELIATLAYGDTAQLWRVNVGRRRRQNPNQLGYVLDIERGYWGKDDDEQTPDDAPPEEGSTRTERVIPYVEDDRNALIIEPTNELDRAHMASLQAALKHAIQTEFQLEDDELVAEPLPDVDRRRTLLFFESAEGGAGVLRRLVDEPHALGRVARTAITILHVDPDTGATIPTPPPGEQCEAACYRCLLSYRNQPDHQLLDRSLVLPVLNEWRHATVTAATGDRTPQEELDALAWAADSGLARELLDYLDEHGHRLPSRSDVLIPEAGTRPDFLYDDASVAVYVDGSPHDYPDRQARDAEKAARLRDLGWTVIRFGHRDDWAQIVDTYRWVFGEGV
jgi:ATP-dependent helicase YprA (DUF1998 family)